MAADQLRFLGNLFTSQDLNEKTLLVNYQQLKYECLHKNQSRYLGDLLAE